jgi:hypothetical protein
MDKQYLPATMIFQAEKRLSGRIFFKGHSFRDFFYKNHNDMIQA